VKKYVEQNISEIRLKDETKIKLSEMYDALTPDNAFVKEIYIRQMIYAVKNILTDNDRNVIKNRIQNYGHVWIFLVIMLLIYLVIPYEESIGAIYCMRFFQILFVCAIFFVSWLIKRDKSKLDRGLWE